MPVTLLLWLALGTVIYAYAGYPILLVCLRRLFERPVTKRPIEPSVSLLIPAHNEAHVIAAKIENALALDYPPDKLEIVVISDGSADDTAGVARSCVAAQSAEHRVRVIEHRTNRGKIAVINECMPALRGEIVVFSDAAAMFLPNAVRRLVRSYADSSVGAVSGVYRVSRPDSVTMGAQEDLYWKYETFLKLQEASMGSILGAHGQIHSVRRSLYPYPPPDTINDDYVIPVRVLQKGYRVAYDPEAVVYEEAHEMTGFGRRVRIVSGNLQQLAEIRGFLWPLRPRCLFYFVSHKVLRLVVPFAMLAALALNALLLDDPGYRALFYLQAAFYVLAGLGAMGQLRPKILRLPYYFCMVNAATFAAAYRAITRRQSVSWN